MMWLKPWVKEQVAAKVANLCYCLAVNVIRDLRRINYTRKYDPNGLCMSIKKRQRFSHSPAADTGLLQCRWLRGGSGHTSQGCTHLQLPGLAILRGLLPAEEELGRRLTSLCLGKVGQSTLQCPACPQLRQGPGSGRGIRAAMSSG